MTDTVFTPPLRVVTPLGEGLAYALCDREGAEVEWLTFICSTGEPWFWSNPHIRLAPCVTDMRGPVSPFTHLTPLIVTQIERYRREGWLK